MFDNLASALYYNDMAKDNPTTKKAKPAGKKDKPMPDRHLLFAAEYVIDFNGTRAYKAVYGDQISDETAAVSASRLLRNDKVCSETERLVGLMQNRRTERRRRVIDNLEQIAYDDLETDVFRDKDGNPLGVSRKDRVRALELLGKTEAMFTDKVEQTGPLSISVNFDPKGV